MTKFRMILAALSVTSLGLLTLPATSHAAPAPPPSGFCPGSSATYPWAAGTLWDGKVFLGGGRLINRTVAGDLVPGTITRISDTRWRIDYPGLPVTDYLTARGGGRYAGTIEVLGSPAGTFALQCR